MRILIIEDNLLKSNPVTEIADLSQDLWQKEINDVLEVIQIHCWRAKATLRKLQCQTKDFHNLVDDIETNIAETIDQRQLVNEFIAMI